MHLSPPWCSQTKPEDLLCPSSPSPHNPASSTMEMGTAARSRSPQRGCVPGSGHAADVEAADLGRRIPGEACVALQACSGCPRPGEACVGVLLAQERLPPSCLSAALSPAPVRVSCQHPGPGLGLLLSPALQSVHQGLGCVSRFLFSCPSGSPCFSAGTSLPHSPGQGDLPQLSWGCGVTAVTSFLGTNLSPYHWCS